MKKIIILFNIIPLMSFAQITANRFYYELIYKPKKNIEKIEKTTAILDITNKKSVYQDYSLIAKDSITKKQIDEMQKLGQFGNLDKLMTMPKFAYKVSKKYPDMNITFSETMFTASTPIQLGYRENIKFHWKISKEKQKIGEYNTQKATTDFGGRKWTAWFTDNISIQDGPYKFYGLPGLIVKIEDENKDYSWTLIANKKIENYEEVSYLEKMQHRGNTDKIMEITKDKFEKSFNEYKKDPFASIR